jgi:hypothetical protein
MIKKILEKKNKVKSKNWNKSLTIKEIEYLEKFIVTSYRFSSITKIKNCLKIDTEKIKKILLKNNVKIINKQNLIRFDPFIFDNINTEEKAYWLGFLFADGYINKKNGLELSLATIDKEHILKFSKFLKFTGKIYEDKSRVRLCISNKYFTDKLKSYNCINNKSLILDPPNISIFKDKNLIKDFIRGYIDGDGCLHLKRNNKLIFSVLGTYQFIEFIQTYILNELFISVNIYKDKRSLNNTFILQTSYSKALKIVDYFYKNSNIYLDRKYTKYKIAVQ